MRVGVKVAPKVVLSACGSVAVEVDVGEIGSRA